MRYELPMPALRILHLITGLGLGGAETWLARLLERLPQDRFDCRVVSLLGLSGGPDGPDGPGGPGGPGALAGRIRAIGVPVQSLGLQRGAFGLPGASGLAGFLRLASLLRQWRPQVVQTWLYHADLLGLLAARASGCGAAVSWGLRSGYMDFSRYGLGTRLTVRACAALSAWPEAATVNSQAGAERHRALGYRTRNMVVLVNGVDGQVFRPDALARARLRAEWGVGGDAVLVGLAARLDPMKGHDVFCAAARSVLERFPEARFVFCGQGRVWRKRRTEPWTPCWGGTGLRLRPCAWAGATTCRPCWRPWTCSRCRPWARGSRMFWPRRLPAARRWLAWTWARRGRLRGQEVSWPQPRPRRRTRAWTRRRRPWRTAWNGRWR